MAWLYRYEAKGIQSYILATQKLREMVGASSLVEDLGKEARLRAADAGGSTIMAAAGSATIEFPDERGLRAFAAGWPMWVARHSPGLQVVQAWASLDGQEFADALKAVLAGLDAARNRPLIDLPEAGPLTARAGRTGRPAVRRGKTDGLQDAATAAKAKADPTDRLKCRLGLEAETLALDVDGFGEGYLAVVHVDGNGVGRRIVERISHKPREAQQAFSLALVTATERAAQGAAKELVARLRGELGKRCEIPFRPLVLGGDDFSAILRAQDAREFVGLYLTLFEQETEQARDALDGRLTACAGVAFVKQGFPFHAAHGLAEDLCRYAKRVLAAGGEARSGLAFYRVTTALVGSLDEALATELSVASPGAAGSVAGRLLGGPWTLDGLASLDALVEAVSTMPRGSLREWLRLVQIDRSRALAHWRRVLDVLGGRSKKAREEFEAALRATGANPDDGFRPDGTTPLLDATTLAGLAPHKTQGARPAQRSQS